MRSHVTEVSSVMTANVSDDQQQQQQQQQQPLGSPPQPVNTILPQQHEYSNIQQPAPLMASAVNSQVSCCALEFQVQVYKFNISSRGI